MCDDDEDSDEAFKSFKPENIRNHITSAHSFSVKMQRKEKFEIRCFLTTTDIGTQASHSELKFRKKSIFVGQKRIFFIFLTVQKHIF